MKNYLTVFRVKEIVGKAGFFMVGIIFSVPPVTVDNILHSFHFFFICLINGLAIYLINAGLGYRHDVSNERLKELQQLDRFKILLAGFIFALVALAWIYFFASNLLFPSVIVYFIWTIYSVPKGFKGIPLMGMTSAFVAQLLHFHIGYMVFGHYSIYSIALSIYFGLLFAGGHALHEVIDYEPDKKARLRTSAVTFGRRTLFLVSNLIFAVAGVYLVIIAWAGIIEWKLIAPYLAAVVVQLAMLFKLSGEPDNAALFSYRRKYMIAYVAGTIVVSGMLYL